jgi:D-glycero-D-manno-heptose 1,7-bisphosphate phosphatase
MALPPTIGVFLDADGVLWPDRGAGEVINGLGEAVSRLTEFTEALGPRDYFRIVIITNQTLAARGDVGYFKFRSKVREVFNSLIKLNLIDSFEVCYHHPLSKKIFLRRKNCRCRKPAPGMILKIIRRYKLNPERCVLIGDRITDIAAGQAAGINTKILINNARAFEVNKGRQGSAHLEDLLEFSLCENLLESVAVIKELKKSD